MKHSELLRYELKESAIKYAKARSLNYQEYETAIIFSKLEDNFQADSYRNIMRYKEHSERLEKRHSHFQDETKEMQSCASSDALLMNIFSYPKVDSWSGIQKLLGIENIKEIEYGFIPNIESDESMTKTEIDMKIGNVFFEAKLTEADFTEKDINTLIKKYPEANSVFNLDRMMIKGDVVGNYQLIRNILTAKKYNGRFILLLDARRTDLIREFYRVLYSIKDTTLQEKVAFITWQEIASVVGDDLKSFLHEKYML